MLRHPKYKFKTLGKKQPPLIDMNIYTYVDKKGSDAKIEWAQVSILEKLEIKEGVQLTQYYEE